MKKLTTLLVIVMLSGCNKNLHQRVHNKFLDAYFAGLKCIAAGKYDSAMYYAGKQDAYLEVQNIK